MTRLVVNADDLGFDPAIDRGILRAHREGIVTSASLLVTGRSAAAAVRDAKAQGLALGVHLCLTSGLPPASPSSAVASVAPSGRLRPSWREVTAAWLWRELDSEEVGREFRSQIRLARDLGADPDHLDGHQHLHLLPGVAEVVRTIAAEEALSVRWPGESAQLRWLWKPGPALKSLLLGGLARALPAPRRRVAGIGLFEAGRLDESRLMKLLLQLSDGDFELGCHPGSQSGPIPEEPAWNYDWEQELAALCSVRIREVVRSRGIQLCTYKQLFQ